MTRIMVIGLLLSAATARAEDTLTVERAVERALERNAEIAARAAAVGAARAREQGARLPLQSNPELRVAGGPRSRIGERSTDVELELTQEVEVFGQRGARAVVARAELAAAEAELALARADVAAQVRIAFARVLTAERLAAIAGDDLELSRESVRVAEKRLELGDGSRLELNAARVEIGRAARETSLARQSLENARSQLRLVVALPPGSELRIEGDLSVSGPAVSQGELVERALSARADLAAARKELEAAQHEERLASREWLPSPRLGVNYAREESADIVLGSVAFDLPVWNRNVAGRGSAVARVSRARTALDAAERRIREDVLLAATRIETAREAVRAFSDDIVTATKESLELTTQAYRSGKLNLVEVLLIRRSAIDARRGHVEALANLAEAEAELRRAVGSGL